MKRKKNPLKVFREILKKHDEVFRGLSGRKGKK